MKTSNDVSNIFSAHIKMQSELSNVSKNADGYGYKYATLDNIIDHIRPVMAKHGLGYIQTTTTAENGHVGVTTRLIHTSGEWVEDTMIAPLSKLAKMNEYQVAGSIITYFRRYALSAMVGIASEDDNDANFNKGNNQPRQPQGGYNNAPEQQVKSDRNINGVSFKQIGFMKNAIKSSTPQQIRTLHTANINSKTIDNIDKKGIAFIQSTLGLNNA